MFLVNIDFSPFSLFKRCEKNISIESESQHKVINGPARVNGEAEIKLKKQRDCLSYDMTVAI